MFEGLVEKVRMEVVTEEAIRIAKRGKKPRDIRMEAMYSDLGLDFYTERSKDLVLTILACPLLFVVIACEIVMGHSLFAFVLGVSTLSFMGYALSVRHALRWLKHKRTISS